jgi:hypothetical protein
MSASSGLQRNGAVLAPRRSTVGDRPPLWTRLRARLLRLSLDSRLARGAPAWGSPELRLRAAQLTSPRERGRLAEELDGVLEAAAQPAGLRGAAVPLDRRAVLACGGLVRVIADDLRHAELVQPRGVALLRQLLRDGGSPLYAPEVEGSLDRSLRHARAALLLD